MLLQNVSNHSPNNTASHHIGPESPVPQLLNYEPIKKLTGFQLMAIKQSYHMTSFSQKYSIF